MQFLLKEPTRGLATHSWLICTPRRHPLDMCSGETCFQNPCRGSDDAKSQLSFQRAWSFISSLTVVTPQKYNKRFLQNNITQLETKSRVGNAAISSLGRKEVS